MADKREQYIMRFAIENGRAVISEMGQIGAAGDKSMHQISDASDLLNQSLDTVYTNIKGRLLTVLGPTALLYSVNRAVSSLADLSREAERAGTSAEQLQKYNYAAEQLIGTSMGMADAVAEFNKRLGEAFAGEGELSEILKRYNIALTDQNGRRRDANDILLDYADAVKEAADQSEKLLLVDKGFGNTSLVKVFDQGSEGLRKLGEQAKETSRVIDDEVIAKAREFDDVWNDIWQRGNAVFKSEVVKTLETAISLLDLLKERTKDGVTSIKALVKTVEEEGVKTFSQEGWKAFLKNVRGENGSVLDGAFEDAYKDFSGTGFVPPSNPNYVEPEKSNRSTSKTKDQIAAEEAAAKRLQNVIDLLKFRNEQMLRSNEEQELYNQLRAAGVDIDSAAGQQIQVLVREYEQLEEQQRKTKETTEAITKAYDGMFERIIDGFADGKISLEEFAQAGMELLKQVLTTRDSVTGENMGGSILSGIFGNLGNVFTSVKGVFGFANGGVMTSRGPLPLRMYENGGVARSPQVAIYGEGKKPEAYVPLPDGRSIPVDMRGSMQTALNVTIIDNAGVDVQTQTSSNGRDATVILNKKMEGAIRNGTMDKAMRDRYGVPRTLRDT